MLLSIYDMKPESVWECVFVCFICMCAGVVKYVHLLIWVTVQEKEEERERKESVKSITS